MVPPVDSFPVMVNVVFSGTLKTIASDEPDGVKVSTVLGAIVDPKPVMSPAVAPEFLAEVRYPANARAQLLAALYFVLLIYPRN